MRVADDSQYLPTKPFLGQLFERAMLIRRKTTSPLQIFSGKLLLLEDIFKSMGVADDDGLRPADEWLGGE